jgi:hypothetical protein
MFMYLIEPIVVGGQWSSRYGSNSNRQHKAERHGWLHDVLSAKNSKTCDMLRLATPIPTAEISD